MQEQAKQVFFKYRRIIRLCLLLILLLFTASLIQRRPHEDDAWLGEHAYWQARQGYVKSELMHGITHQETRFLCHHKLLTLQGALSIRLFGFSAWSLKSVSLAYLLIFVFLFYHFTRKKIFSRDEFFLALLIFIAHSLIFEYSFVFRPEIPLMALGFISYMFIEKTLAHERRAGLFAALSGFFAGLCVATHLNGLIFPAAGFLLLAWNRKFVHAVIFLIAALPALLIYFYDFTSQYGLQFWLYQLNQTPSHERMSDLPVLLSYLLNLANEHMRFFHSPMEIAFSVLFLVVVISGRKGLRGQGNLVRYTVILAVFLALLTVHKTSKYMIAYLPYLMIMFVLSLRYIFSQNGSVRYFRGRLSNTWLRRVIAVLFGIFVSIHIFYDLRITWSKWSSKTNRDITRTYIHARPGMCRIIAPMTFIFNEIPYYQSIQSELAFSEMKKSDPTIFQGGFLRRANDFNADHIILSRNFIRKFGLDVMSDAEISAGNFHVIMKSPDMMILEKNSPIR